MIELVELVRDGALPWFLLTLLVFGFAPGFVLRLLVLLYPKRNPRRRELVAELYEVPRIERPMWVAEQIEVALFEGLAIRLGHIFRAARHPIRLSVAFFKWQLGSWRNHYGMASSGREDLHLLVPFWIARLNGDEPSD